MMEQGQLVDLGQLQKRFNDWGKHRIREEIQKLGDKAGLKAIEIPTKYEYVCQLYAKYSV